MKQFAKISGAIVISAFLLSGCTKKFEDINTDSNKVTADKYVPEYNLTRAQLEFTGNSDFSFEVWRVNIIYCGMMMQQLANTSWYAGDKYMQNDGWAASYFDVAYRDQVKYIADLLEITKDNPALSNLYQVGRIMKVMIFSRLSDIYGDIPYTEAGLGYYGRIFTPKYDKQQDAYQDMLKELDQAAQALDPAKARPGNGDLIYRGASDNIAKWKKLAYSLMLRLGMRMIKADATGAKTWVEKAYAGGVMASNTDNAYILHDASGGRTTINRNSNILSGEWNATGWDRSSNAKTEVFLSKTFVDFLKNNNDPRLQYMALVRANGNSTPASQVGMPNGYDQNGAAKDISTAPGYPGDILNYSTIRGDVFLKLNGPTILLTYGQCELLLAEAAKRGWSVGASAAIHYNNGVTATMKQIAQYDAGAVIPDLAITTYLTAHPYVDATGYDQINTQYWASCFLDWYEAWSNWRRSGYPVLTPVNYTGNATSGQIPRRMLYPSSEASVNGDSYSAAISRQGANTFLTRVWWDKP
jgi:hypothetical protein